MAELGDDPMQAQAAAPGFDVGDIGAKWQQFIDDPSNRAAMIQTGLAMMQPVGLGQTTGGHIAQAIGQGGEATDRITGMEMAEREQVRKEGETASRGELRASQAETGAFKAESGRQQVEVNRLRANNQYQGLLHRKDLAEAKIREINAKIEALASKPQTDQVKRDLMAAQTEAARANAGLREAQRDVVQFDSETKRMGVDVRQQDADTRRDLGQQRVDQGAARLDFMRGSQAEKAAHWARQDQNERQKIYDAAKLVGGKSVPSKQQWEKEQFGTSDTPAATPAPATTKPTTTAPAAGATPVGTERIFAQGTYEKIAPGPDTDQSTWRKVD